MPQPSPSVGHFIWFELFTPDVEAAVAFYSAVIGWTVESTAAGYRMWRTPGGPLVGGVEPLSPSNVEAAGSKARWLPNLCVGDVAAALAVVERQGGRVERGPFEVPKVARVAFIRDPLGTALVLYEPIEFLPELGLPIQPGGLAWADLATPDPERAWAFYAELAGWREAGSRLLCPDPAASGSEPPRCRLFAAREGGAIGAIFPKPAHVPVSAWKLHIHVADLDASLRAATTRGGQVLHGPEAIGTGFREVVLRDPEGAVLALHGR